jgi:hypothetical protein
MRVRHAIVIAASAVVLSVGLASPAQSVVGVTVDPSSGTYCAYAVYPYNCFLGVRDYGSGPCVIASAAGYTCVPRPPVPVP